VIDCLKARLKD